MDVSNTTEGAEDSCDEVELDTGDDELQTVIRIIEIKDKYSKELSYEQSWSKISEQLNISITQCKFHFTSALSKYKKSEQNLDKIPSKLHELIRRLEENLDFDFCLVNFSQLCRFCCRFRSDFSSDFREIFDDSSEETLAESNELIEKIHYTLYDNILDKVDFKLSNLICSECSNKIESFFAFKNQCDRSAELLQAVKNEFDKMQLKPDEENGEINENEVIESVENLENEDEGENSCETSNRDEDEEEEVSEISENDDEDVLEEKSEKIKKKIKKTAEKKDRKSYKSKSSQCPICGKIVKGIQMHMLIHTGEKKHKCSYCSKSFTQSGQLKRHINSHLNIRNYKCPEPFCDRTFVDPSSVTKHLVVHNKDDRKFQCSLCGSRFNRLGALRYHEKTHRQERNHTCDICKKSFLAKYDLTKHYRTHTGEKPYSCKFCDKKFSISKNAKVHLRVHTKEKPYSCKFCDLSFAYRSSMKNHLIKIHNHIGDVSSLPFIQNEIDNLQPQLNVIEMEAIELDHHLHP